MRADVHGDVVSDDMAVATDTNQQGTSPPSGDDLAGIVVALTHQGKSTLLQHGPGIADWVTFLDTMPTSCTTICSMSSWKVGLSPAWV